jgi:hypothetical protein
MGQNHPAKRKKKKMHKDAKISRGEHGDKL